MPRLAIHVPWVWIFSKLLFYFAPVTWCRVIWRAIVSLILRIIRMRNPFLNHIPSTPDTIFWRKDGSFFEVG